MQVQTPITESSDAGLTALWPYCILFFISGFPALIYQIVWQRALFAIYGVNIQSVTVIVTVFMLGLGFGSLAGGRLSKVPGLRVLIAFGAIESASDCLGPLRFPYSAGPPPGRPEPRRPSLLSSLLLYC